MKLTCVLLSVLNFIVIAPIEWTPIVLSTDVVWAEDADKDLTQTIEHLINFIESSGNTFVRNGKEYNSHDAAKHVRNKYIYYKHSIRSPEDFIEKAASTSMMTGIAYMLKLPDGSFKELKGWLLEELEKYRNSHR